MGSEEMTDRERIFAARKFFWEIMDRLEQPPVSVEVAHRQINKLAECLPPFTRIPEIPHDQR